MAWLGAPVLLTHLPIVASCGSSWSALARDALRLRRAHAKIILVSGNDAELKHAAIATTLGGAHAVLLFATGTPRRLPSWERRFHRYLVSDQETARSWAQAGVSLGRLTVIAPPHADEALAAVLREVRSMSGS